LGLKVLHVWNTAGVGSVIAKFCDRGSQMTSTVITRQAADRVGLTTYGRAYADGPARFFLRAVSMARSADLVHVHSLDRVVPWVKRLWGKPVVMHYHGTDIEGRWNEKRGRWGMADYLAVSTPNLLEGGPSTAVWIPNPVDTDIFKPLGVGRDPKSAVSFHYGMDDEAEDATRRLGLTLTWLDRWSVRHEEMPQVLSKFAYFIDLRKPPEHVQARSVGKAALEALACGCKVLDWSGNTLEGLPPDNGPQEVAAKWTQVYQGLVKK
jgi:hypothetical protein